MPGPPPKDPKIRQRRNRASTATRLEPDEKRRRYAPRLPDLGEDKKWHALTVAWWRDVWHSPMAEQYLEADKHALYRLAVLVDAFWKEPSRDLAGEIRLQQQAFGLTPIDRRRLQWSVEQEEARRRPRPVPAAEPAAQGDAADDDPRKILEMRRTG